MKKNVLALSIAAMIGGFAGVAQAAVVNAAGATAATGAAMGTNVSTDPGVVGTKAALATVLEVNPNNIGHMLVVPYYTAQNGNMTVLHLSNTDRSNGKAVKIRFRGAANSDDVKDFQIYLSPGDIWTGAIAQGANNVATLYTSDTTCTVPQIPATGTDFATARLPATDTGNGTREGYIEIFNMADIPSVKLYNADGTAGVGTANSQLYTAIKHVGGKAPCSEAGAARTTLDTIAMTNFTTAAGAAAVGFGSATTGLSADWYILNLNQSTNYSGAATAIEARTAANGPAGAANFVHFPQTDAGSSAYFGVPAAGNFVSADTYTADPLLRAAVVDASNTARTGPVTPLFIDLPDMSTPYVTPLAGAATDANLPKVQAAILTRALARTSVSNQYALDAGINAATDWVFSMPTRRYSVAANYTVAPTGATAAQYRLFSGLDFIQASSVTAVPGSAPGWFTAANTRVDARANICTDATSMRFFDREETTTGAAPIFSPATASSLSFCGETSVLSFSANQVLGSSSALTATTMTTPYVNGWTVVSTPNPQTTVAATNMTNAAPNGAGVAVGANTPVGLPIVGDAFIKVNNTAAAGGFTSTFGITWAHRYNQ